MKRLVCPIAVLTLLLNLAVAQSTKQARGSSYSKESGGNSQAATSPVTGSGTPGRISKWSGVLGSSTFTLGDSNIFEDKFGKVGVNTASPTSPLTVRGMIETTLGGIKFPDGTVQTTAALGGLQVVVHDSTLRGDGTSGSPLGVAIPLNLTGDAEILVKIRNDGDGGLGMSVLGGNSGGSVGGHGLLSTGGKATREKRQ